MSRNSYACLCELRYWKTEGFPIYISIMRNVRIVPPATLTGIRLKHLKDAACGVPAVTSTFKHIADEMGMIKGWKLLQKLNQ
jgi:hypothetical protein